MVSIPGGVGPLNHVSMKAEFIRNHPVLVQIATIVGDDATLSIVAAFGGKAIYPSSDRFEPVIGRDAAAILAKELRGGEIYIPSCLRESIDARNGELVEKFDTMTKAGMSTRQAVSSLADEFRLSDRRVWKILKRGSQ